MFAAEFQFEGANNVAGTDLVSSGFRSWFPDGQLARTDWTALGGM